MNIKDIEDEGGEEDEEPGEEVESAPPLKVGQEREIGSNGLRKKLIKSGANWETPQFGDEVTSTQSTPTTFLCITFHFFVCSQSLNLIILLKYTTIFCTNGCAFESV